MGYPDQCLMEDYELIRLLRLRSQYYRSQNHRRPQHTSTTATIEEHIQLLPSPYQALCSPRRWQHYGVLYTTYTNSKLVWHYNTGRFSPEALYQKYYGEG